MESSRPRKLGTTHQENCENLPEGSSMNTSLRRRWFNEKCLSRTMLFLPLPDARFEGFGSTSPCRDCTYPQSDERSRPARIYSRQHPNWSGTGSHGQKRFDHPGIETKTDSMKKDGTHFWMVIGRSIDHHVTELAVDHTKPVHLDEASSSTEKLVSVKQWTEQL